MIRRTTQAIPAVLLLGLLLGCHQDMVDQPKVEPLESSRFFQDGRGSRPVVEGTVARGELQEDEAYWHGRRGDEPVVEIPVPLTSELLARGRQRYEIYCSPCHDMAGTGNGMVVQRGFKPPPSLHTQRLREAPAGHFYQVIANGFGVMYPYGDRVTVPDRWAIVAWIRALQLSQYAPADALPEDVRRAIPEPTP